MNIPDYSSKPFICFEGPDGCGKTTQALLLTKALEKSKLNYIFKREPGGTLIGEKIRELVLNHSIENNTSLDFLNDVNVMSNLLLFITSRLHNIAENIIPSLESNKFVLVDRFILSTMVYQGGNNQDILKKIKTLHKEFNFNLYPSLTLVLSLDYSTALKRLSSRKEKNLIDNKSEDFHKNIENIYSKAKDFYNGNLLYIDAKQNLLSLHNNIVNEINARFNTKIIPLTQSEVDEYISIC